MSSDMIFVVILIYCFYIGLTQIILGTFFYPSFVFAFAIIVLRYAGRLTLKYGFKNLTVKRQVNENAVFEGQDFRLVTVIENAKWFPVSFVLVREEFFYELDLPSSEEIVKTTDYQYRISKYSVSWFERLRRPCIVKARKRGVYLLRRIEVTIRDTFGNLFKTEGFDDILELVVYPKLIDIQQFRFLNTSLQGDYTVQRWIHNDPLYIKGIREYRVEDRMKDIHWKSSLKSNKLMVKDYDFTSERDIVLILNVDCKAEKYNATDFKGIDLAAELIVSLAKDSIDKAVPVGIWTNAYMNCHRGNYGREIPSSINNFKEILEFCARVNYLPRTPLARYLREKAPAFKRDTQYILVTPFIDEDSSKILSRLTNSGYLIRIIDVASEGNLPTIPGIYQMKCTGREEDTEDTLYADPFNPIVRYQKKAKKGKQSFEQAMTDDLPVEVLQNAPTAGRYEA